MNRIDLKKVVKVAPDEGNLLKDKLEGFSQKQEPAKHHHSFPWEELTSSRMKNATKGVLSLQRM